MSYLDRFILQELALKRDVFALIIDGTFFFEQASDKDFLVLRIFTNEVDAKRRRDYLSAKQVASKIEKPDAIRVGVVNIDKVTDKAEEFQEHSFENFGGDLKIIVTSCDDKGNARDVVQLYPVKELKLQN